MWVSLQGYAEPLYLHSVFATVNVSKKVCFLLEYLMIKKLILFTCLLTGYQCFAMEKNKKEKWQTAGCFFSRSGEKFAQKMQNEKYARAPLPKEDTKNWDEFDKRAAKVRQEQERRKKQAQDTKQWCAFEKRAEQVRQKQERHKEPSVTTEEGDNYRNVNIDFGEEGMSVDEFVALLRKAGEKNKEAKHEGQWKVTTTANAGDKEFDDMVEKMKKNKKTL